MLTDDLITLINRLCPTVKNVVNDVVWTQTQPTWGVMVRQRQTTGTTHPLIRTDTRFVDIIVRGSGKGAVGRKAAHDTAMTLYKALDLVPPTTVGETHFLRITTDSSPFEIPSEGDCWDYQLGLSVTTYYGD